jgi:hypothetical protein
MNSTKIF